MTAVAPPLVSVLMSTRDERPGFLERALDSILAQTLQDLEIVLIDDGSSSPATLQALERWATRDARIRLYRQPPRGLTASLNFGLAQCRAPWIARHDSDDWSEPGRLARQVAALAARPEVGLIGSQFMAHMAGGRPLWRSQLPGDHARIVRALPHLNPFCHGAVMFPRALALRVGGYRDVFQCSQDYDFFWRLSEITMTGNLDEVLYHYRYSGGAVSALRAADQARVAQMTRVLARMRSSGGEDIGAARAEVERSLAKTDLRRLALRKRADGLLLGGERRRAVRAFLDLLLSYPLAISSYVYLMRCAAFLIVPPLRRRLFGG